MTHRGAPLGILALVVGLFSAQAAHADIWQPLEQWRIVEGRIAPWAAAGTQIDPAYRNYPNSEVRFQTTRLAAPHPLACEPTTYEWIFGPAEGLFEGNLPAPAANAAQKLGLGPEPIATLRVGCPNAGFDFHRTRGGDLQIGLDNVVWTLRAASSPSTPAEIVQALLITHFTNNMGFTRDSVALKKTFLSADLQARIETYMAAPQSPDEAPEINGDPFTDTQEYPDRFTLGPIQWAEGRTTVPVHFADAHMKRRVDYVLVSEGNRWVVDDLIDERSQSLRDLLRVEPTETFDGFFLRFRDALVTGRDADVAAMTRAPFLFEGKQLDTAGITRIVPTLFSEAVKRCLATAKPVPEEGRQVVFCEPYAFYFGQDASGFRLQEFGADGEAVP